MKVTLCRWRWPPSWLTAVTPLMAQTTSPEGTYTLNVSPRIPFRDIV